MADKRTDKRGKKPFVSKADRPEVRLKSDTPLSDLTVRDLATILGQLGTRKDFWDGKDWQKDDFDGQNKPWKEDKEFKEGKEVKDKDKETKEGKEGKEKREIKEQGREARARRRLRPEFDRRPAHRAGDPRALRHVGQGRPARRPDRGAEKAQGLSWPQGATTFGASAVVSAPLGVCLRNVICPPSGAASARRERRCAVGSCRGLCLSMAPYVRGDGTPDTG